MENLLIYILKYRYFILFPLSIVEGPIIAIVAGFLCRQDVLNFWMVYIILIVGDNIGDTMYYALGYWSNSPLAVKLMSWLGIKKERLEKVKTYFGNNPFKAITFSKLILGVGVAGLFLAGKSKIPYARFFTICLFTSFVQSLVYLVVGWFFGEFYLQINHYFNYFASISIVVVLAVVLFYIVRSKLKKL